MESLENIYDCDLDWMLIEDSVGMKICLESLR